MITAQKGTACPYRVITLPPFFVPLCLPYGAVWLW